jgi:hypothetical protein
MDISIPDTGTSGSGACGNSGQGAVHAAEGPGSGPSALSSSGPLARSWSCCGQGGQQDHGSALCRTGPCAPGGRGAAVGSVPGGLPVRRSAGRPGQRLSPDLRLITGAASRRRAVAGC